MSILLRMYVFVALASVAAAAAKPKKINTKSPLDVYISEVTGTSPITPAQPAAGSIWTAQARFSDIASDLRATRLDDIITIIVNESASAVSTGTSKSQRSSTAKAGVSAIAGVTRATGPLANLAGVTGTSQLDGTGTTSRETTLTTTMAARVTHVLANGNLVVQGTKNITVNSENQIVSVRGIVRPVDLSTGNTVASNRIALMEVQVNGHGIVGDAVRRPFFLYRLLLGILPF